MKLTEKDIRDLEFYAKTHTVGIFDLKVSVAKDVLLELCAMARNNVPAVSTEKPPAKKHPLEEIKPIISKSPIPVADLVLKALDDTCTPLTDAEIQVQIEILFNTKVNSSSVRTRRSEMVRAGLVVPGPKVSRAGRLVATWMIKKGNDNGTATQ